MISSGILFETTTTQQCVKSIGGVNNWVFHPAGPTCRNRSVTLPRIPILGKKPIGDEAVESEDIEEGPRLSEDLGDGESEKA